MPNVGFARSEIERTRSRNSRPYIKTERAGFPPDCGHLPQPHRLTPPQLARSGLNYFRRFSEFKLDELPIENSTAAMLGCSSTFYLTRFNGVTYKIRFLSLPTVMGQGKEAFSRILYAHIFQNIRSEYSAVVSAAWHTKDFMSALRQFNPLHSNG